MGIFFSSADDDYVSKRLNVNFCDGDISKATDPLLLHLNPLFQTGNVRPIEIEDVGKLEGEMASESSTKRIKATWADEMTIPNKERRSLLRALFKADGLMSNFLATCLYITSLVARYTVPEIINRLLSHVSGENVMGEMDDEPAAASMLQRRRVPPGCSTGESVRKTKTARDKA